MAGSFEQGSNLSTAVGFIGMEEVKAKLREVYENISVPYLHEALYASALVFQNALIAATPYGSEEYIYRYGSRTVRVKPSLRKEKGMAVSPGQAKSNVIIYERKGKGLSEDVAAMSLLVGHAKKKGWYAYWLERGTGGRAHLEARGFAIDAYEASLDAAFEAARNIFASRIGS